MQQQPQFDMGKDWKRNFNIVHSLCVIHQRGIVVTCRQYWGVNALGFPCLFALVLMLLWWMATEDAGMLVWIGLWLMFLVKRRVEAGRIEGKVHSHYDGHTINLGSDEARAKMLYEPVLVGVLGAILCWFYREQGWRITGLPCFLLLGTLTLRSVAAVQQMAWRRRIQGMQDAKMEQEMLVEDFQNRP